MSGPPPTSDVRMRGFSQRTTVESALAWLDAHLAPLTAENVSIDDAYGRVLADDVTSYRDVPAFDRAMMDGYAVLAADTQGANSYNPLPLAAVGTSMPGHPSSEVVSPGRAVRIMTGAPVPQGADAVLPFEKTRCSRDDDKNVIEIISEVAASGNIGRRGEDVRSGTVVFARGRRLRPQDVGLLSAVAAGEISVVGRPRVRIVITGDEVVPAGSVPSAHQIADANGPMLAALVRRDGADCARQLMVVDDRDAIANAMQTAAEENTDDCVDVLLISGGSSVGQEDFAPVLLAELGELAVHGIAMRPSSPAGMGRIGQTFVFLLPGNPVSCLCAYDFFAGRAIRALGGRSANWPYRHTRAPLGGKISSVVGRVDYCRVRVRTDAADTMTVEPLAISGASVLSSTTRADGFVIVPADHEGYPAGADVDVYMYDD